MAINHKRKRKVIPIDAVRIRKSKLSEGIVSRHRRRYYPLYETYLDIYNYQNLKESILNWNEFSQNVNVNITQVCKLLEQIGQRGTEFEIQEATDLVLTNVLPYLSRPTIYINNFQKMKNVDESKELILEKIREEAECDRILANYTKLSNRYNPEKFFTESLKHRDFTTTMYYFCALMETYNMPLKQKYAVTIENALYALSNITQTVPTKAVIENVIDYFMIYREGTDIYKFVNDIQDATLKDDFIPDSIVNNYVDYILECADLNDDRERKITKEEYVNSDIFKLIEEYDKYHQMSGGMKALYEATMVDKAKALQMQFKISPTKLSEEAKRLMLEMFYSTHLKTENYFKSAQEALKTIYYCCSTLDLFSKDIMDEIFECLKTLVYNLYQSGRSGDNSNIEFANAFIDHFNMVKSEYEYTTDLDRKQRLQSYLEKMQKIIKEFDIILNLQFARKEDKV